MKFQLDRYNINKIYDICVSIHSKNRNTVGILKNLNEIDSSQLDSIIKLCKSYEIIKIDGNNLYSNYNSEYKKIARKFIKYHLPNTIISSELALIIKGRRYFVNNCRNSNLLEVLEDANLIFSYDQECAEIWKFWENIARVQSEENMQLYKTTNGLCGEYLSIQYEECKVGTLAAKYGFENLKPKLIAIDFPNEGYDIESYYLEESCCEGENCKAVIQYIESKTTTNMQDGFVYITWNEYEKLDSSTISGLALDKYQIHLWDIEDIENPKLYILLYQNIIPPVLPEGVSLDYFKIKIKSLGLSNPIILKDLIEL